MPVRQSRQKPKMERRKSLPNNTEAEKAVLGAMLTNDKLCEDTFAELNEEDFFDSKHQSIYAAMLKLRNNTPIDIQTVGDELINANKLELIGGSEYLFDLASSYVGYENAKHCIDIVRDQALLRRFLLKMNEVSESYYTEEIDDIGSFISDSEKALLDVTRKRHIADFQGTKEITEKLQANIEKMKKADESFNIGVTTGFRSLNKLIHGFQPKQMIILAARTAVGKTSFGLNLCYNAVRDPKNTVAYFSLEMPSEQLMTRIVSCESGVPQESINLGMTSTSDKLAIKQACDRISKCNLFVDDTPGIKVADLFAKATKLKNDHPELGLIVVDYIGLVKLNDKVTASDSRQQIIQEVSQELKRLAMKLDVAIILVAQLNRNVESRGESAMPMLSDLRESGSLEQDADVVLLMSAANFSNAGIGSKKGRGQYGGTSEGNDDSKQSALKSLMSQYDKSTQLIVVDVAKNRAGRQGQVYLLFKKDICKFIEPDDNFLQAIKNIKQGIIPSKDNTPTE